jgi:predicted exporter
MARYRRGLILLGGLLLVGAAVWRLSTLRFSEDVRLMIPDNPGLQQQFELLRSAPFSRRILVSLHAEDDALPPGRLTDVADAVCGRLQAAPFRAAISGPPAGDPAAPVTLLLEHLPGYFTEDIAAAVTARSTDGALRLRVEEWYRRLLSPEGWGIKERLRRDPFDLAGVLLGRLRSLHVVPNLRLNAGHFTTPDGGAAMVMAESDVSLTDSGGGRRLLATLRTILAEEVPPGIRARFVCGHRYSVANADTILRDLRVVFAAALVGNVLVLALFLRLWQSSVVVLVLPQVAVCLAAAALSFFRTDLSMLTLGFGAVLLGICDDSGIHVYYALAGTPAGLRRERLREVVRPIVFCALTTLATFALLLLSPMPGQRELAVLAVLGIVLSTLLSFVVLPLIIPAGDAGATPYRQGWLVPEWHLPRRLVLGVWAAVMLAGICFAFRVKVDGELRHLGVEPAAAKEDELEIQRTWGQTGARALVACEGEDLETALQRNEEFFATASRAYPPGELVSLAPLLPSAATQQRNQERWQRFWAAPQQAQQLQVLRREALTAGFAAGVFDPFYESLGRLPAALSPDLLRRAGLGDLVDMLVTVQPGRVRILSLVPDDERLAALALPPGAATASGRRFAAALTSTIMRSFLVFLGLAIVLTVALLAWLFHSPLKVFAAALPFVTGIVVMLGAMGLFHLPLNLFNALAAVLVVGLTVDFGIFMASPLSERGGARVRTAVAVCALTTLTGFGALVLARHPALHAIGQTVLLGIGSGVVAAVLVIPALLRRPE